MCLVLIFAVAFRAAAGATLSGHVPHVVKDLHLQPIGHFPGTNRLSLAIGLPVRDQDALARLLEQIYDPASPNYHHYLTPTQFTERFGPTASDYFALEKFARSNGLEISHTHANRLVLDVSGTVAVIEKAFRVHLLTYHHPTEARDFYAPDADPVVSDGLKMIEVRGLENYAVPKPAFRLESSESRSVSANGTGDAGRFLSADFRTSYASGVTANGAGQMVGLLEFDGYSPVGIASYESRCHITNGPALVNVLLDGFSGNPGPANAEVALDIEMAIGMAPGLSQVVLFEAPDTTSAWIDILNSMASSNQIKQFSSSWGYEGTPTINSTIDQILQQMALQGQSFFQASGDGDAWVNPVWIPAASPYLTTVGGTTLAMNGLGASYGSESVWNQGYTPPAWSPNGSGYWGSGGGISSNYAVPFWQRGIVTSSNQASATFRNIPDVAMTAQNVEFYPSNVFEFAVGTSCSAPLWAGFMALVNQQAAARNIPPVGFPNPALYAVGVSSNYALCFHDISSGNNVSGVSPAQFSAVPGYDLCTGWGTPNGTNLINALTPSPLVQNGGFEAGDFSGWTSSGNFSNCFVSGKSDYVHSGNYGAALGSVGSLGYLSQTIPTIAGSLYLISLWLDSPDGETNNAFRVSWNGNTLFNQTNLGALGWTNLQFVGMATATNTALEFGFRDDPSFLGLDDVSVVPVPTPAFLGTTRSNGEVTFTWSAPAGFAYQAQSATNLLQAAWANLGTASTATNGFITISDSIGPSSRFYRIVPLP